MITQVGAKYANMATTSLRDLFSGSAEGKFFRVNLQVLAVQPGDVKEMTKYCTLQLFSFTFETY